MTTPRLGLVKPDPEDLYSLSVWNGNSDKLDAAVGVIVCTSSTRPSTPWNGMSIYETDTQALKVWDGDSWEGNSPGILIGLSSAKPNPVQPNQMFYEIDTGLTVVWNGTTWLRINPGLIAARRWGGTAAVLTTTVSNTTEQVTAMETGNVVLPANRAFKMTARIEWDVTGSGAVGSDWNIRLRNGSVSGSIISQVLNEEFTTSGVRQQALLEGISYTTGSDSTVNFIVTMQRIGSATAQARVYRDPSCPFISIELLGPSILVNDM